MLSLFPELLFLAPLAAFMIRFAVAGVLFYTAWTHITKTEALIRSWGVLETAAALLLIAGAWTQAIAFVVSVGLFAALFVPQFRALPKSTLLLCLIMTLTLVFTGAGAFALDLPL